MSFPQYLAWRDAMKQAQAYLAEQGESAQQAEYDLILLAGLRPCVEVWGLNSGFVPEPFPATPRVASSKLIAWLIRETSAIANAADDTDPN